ncbi:Wzz/FepE/Etk N-terminal domain-containing protein [Synechocystis sp. PCC 7339]|uniref:Wzz/FepE/Etk N-terminal domain-containing protein n=1 Tax=Synechocystis sp. PCC 7339 TaxID=2782213 RepID=UPI001CBFDBC7|nr:Wzz/FepE/Etk N-terminal domain-containing protein [Synechocystis sp. PCC 7339]
MTYSYPELPQGSPPPPLVGVYGAEEVDSFSLSNLTGVLRRRWWIVILVALAVGGLNLKRQLDKPPVFQSSFQLLVSPPRMKPLTLWPNSRVRDCWAAFPGVKNI